MENELFNRLISLDKSSPIPIYQQLVFQISRAIENEELKKGQICPSINQLSGHLEISRATVEKVFFVLRKNGFISAFHGKCYYVSRNSPESHPLSDSIMFKSLYQ